MINLNNNKPKPNIMRLSTRSIRVHTTYKYYVYDTYSYEYSNGQTTNLYQVFMTDEDKALLIGEKVGRVPSIRHLLFYSLIHNDLKFAAVCLTAR